MTAHALGLTLGPKEKHNIKKEHDYRVNSFTFIRLKKEKKEDKKKSNSIFLLKVNASEEKKETKRKSKIIFPSIRFSLDFSFFWTTKIEG